MILSPNARNHPAKEARSGAWLLVAALLLAYALSFVDRQILSLLVADLRRDLELSDPQIGLLQGPAFGVFYAVLGLPFGWLADRTHRLRLIAAALLLWTVMTLAGGFATSFTMLLATRMGVGVGEAALVPAAVSLLADSFPPDRRALPLAIFTSGVSAGAGLALVIGGALVGLASGAQGSGGIPFVGPLLAGRATWQSVMILAGAAGIPLALIMLALREPQRASQAHDAQAPKLSTWLSAHRRLFIPLLAGSSLLYVYSNALSAWLPSWFERGFGWTPQLVGGRLGPAILIGAIAGNLASGLVATALISNDRPHGALLTMSGGALLLAPIAILGPQSASPALAVGAVVATYFAIALCFGVATTALVAVTPPDMRGRMVALYLLLGNLIGMSLGPPSIGILLQSVLADPAQVGDALSIVASVVVVAGAYLLVRALRPHAVLAATLMVSGCTTIPSGKIDIPIMVKLEVGRFIAGSSPAETDAVHYPPVNAAREQPARLIIITRPFAIGRTEITRGQFAQFVRAVRWKPDGPCSFFSAAPDRQWRTDTVHDWQNPGYTQTDAHPVVCIDLSDATAYANWLSKRTGRHFRLPSNTEWEYAARAGTTTPQFWDGNDDANPCGLANLNDMSSFAAHADPAADRTGYFGCTDGYAATAPVASFRPNPWGLYDTIGNVWELTADCLNADQVGAPTDQFARRTGDCRSHIDRGSSWGNTPKYVRIAAQHPDLVNARTAVLGFRLVEDFDE